MKNFILFVVITSVYITTGCNSNTEEKQTADLQEKSAEVDQKPAQAPTKKPEKIVQKCTNCNGTGKVDCSGCYGAGKKDCSDCNSTGKINAYFVETKENGYQYATYRGQTEYVWVWANHYADFPCKRCDKTGKIDCINCYGARKKTCAVCHGTTTIESTAFSAENAPPVAPQNTSSSIPGKYPQTAERLLTHADISGLSKWDLRIMRNEIFARHGYIFKTTDMKSYFDQQLWYTGKYDNVNASLSQIEKSNIEFIKSYE
jgi:hypothetical protein